MLRRIDGSDTPQHANICRDNAHLNRTPLVYLSDVHHLSESICPALTGVVRDKQWQAQHTQS
ncbi:MAG: hypothetical protein AAF846_00525 [Chloroflexota bacterium]